MIQRSCELKADVVAKDEREETGLRAVLNYGHTFAHAFEIAAGYGGWLHGEAVSAGMACASRLAQRRGLISQEITDRQIRLLEAFSLPTSPEFWDTEALLTTMRTDKKAVAGRMRFILPRRLGEVALFDDVPEDDVREILRSDESLIDTGRKSAAPRFRARNNPWKLTMQLTSEERDWLALHLVPGIGPRLASALLGALLVRQPKPSFAPHLRNLRRFPIYPPSRLRRSKNRWPPGMSMPSWKSWRNTRSISSSPGNAGIPAALATIALPPRFIYVRGTLDFKDAIAVVGSRQCTSYGRRIAERLAGDLARAGFTVISGLARGIDACAHRGALDAGGRTLAVLAGGLSKIYPPEHADLADAVAASGGLVTESAMRMEPMAGMFPARNRIISGMCRAVVLVEANEKSGALITARHAAEQGREVFAVPGPVDNPASAGTLKLLREGAKLIRHARDLLDDMQTLAPLFSPLPSNTTIPSRIPSPTPAGLDELQQKLWDFLSETRNVDDLARHACLTTAALSGVLMTLELKKVIRRLPGNKYERF